ncbi:MAG: DUF72 domain-containing protein [Pseudomonadota bacterium]
MTIRIGTAGWSIPRSIQRDFRGKGSHLHRYAIVLGGVEINSSFYRSHAKESYAKWAAAAPRSFRFAVKVPQTITHDLRLRRTRTALTAFLGEVNGLGSKLGPLLIQLPPSLNFESRVARRFFALLRDTHRKPVVCEPRHNSWFTSRAEDVLREYRIGRVAADPALTEAAAVPGGWMGTVYYRLHGSPRRYWSVYTAAQVKGLAQVLVKLPRTTDAWCVFDNTASGGAALNALQLSRLTSVRR